MTLKTLTLSIAIGAFLGANAFAQTVTTDSSDVEQDVVDQTLDAPAKETDKKSDEMLSAPVVDKAKDPMADKAKDEMGLHNEEPGLSALTPAPHTEMMNKGEVISDITTDTVPASTPKTMTDPEAVDSHWGGQKGEEQKLTVQENAKAGADGKMDKPMSFEDAVIACRGIEDLQACVDKKTGQKR